MLVLQVNAIFIVLNVWSPPSAVYMRQRIGSALFQMSPIRRQAMIQTRLGYCQLDPKEQTLVKFQSKYNFFIRENASENIVYEMEAILSNGRWVN